MADTIKSAAQIAAEGFDYASAVPTEVSAIRAAEGQNVLAEQQQRKQTRFDADRSIIDTTKDAFSNELTANLYRSVAPSQFDTPDPPLTPDDFSKRIKEVEQELGPNYLDNLTGATGTKDFDIRVARAREHKAAEQRLAMDGFTGTAAKLTAGLLDPASLGIFIASGGAAGAAAKLARLNQGRSFNAALGGAQGLMIEGAKDALGPKDIHASEYLIAAGAGATLMGLFGPIAKNPATAEEAQRVARLGKSLEDRVDTELAKAIEAGQLKSAKTFGPVIDQPPPAAAANDLEALVKASSLSHGEGMKVPTAANDTVGLKAANDARAPLNDPAAIGANDNRIAQLAPEPVQGMKPTAPGGTVADEFINGLKAANENLKVVDQKIIQGVEDTLRRMAPANDATATTKTVTVVKNSKELENVTDRIHHVERHRYPVSNDHKGKFNFLTDGGAEEKFLAAHAGPVVQRLRMMGIDVRAFTGFAGESGFAGRVGGFYAKKDKLVALNTSNERWNPKQIAEHEEIHALIERGGLTTDEIAILANEARRTGAWKEAAEGASMQHYKSLGAKGQQLESLHTEEALAKLVGNNQHVGEGEVAAIINSIRSGERAALVAQKEGVEPLRLYEFTERQRNAPTPVERQFLSDIGLANLSDADVARTFTVLGYGRMDIAGWLGKSRNTITRVVGDLLFNDTVGKVGHATNGAARELVKTRLMQRHMNDVNKAVNPAYQEWLTAQGKSAFSRDNRVNWNMFNEEVGKAIRGITPEAEVSPAVAKAAAAHRKMYADMAEQLANPLKDAGGVGRPVYGAQGLEANGTYFTRRFHQGRMNDLVTKYGFDNVVAVTENAMRTAMPDIPDEILKKMARGYTDRAHRAANGVEEDLGVVIAAGQRDVLAQHLREFGLSESEIGFAVSKVMPKDGEVGTISVLKQKTLLDETASHTFIDAAGVQQTIRFQDMLVHNADEIMRSYLTRTTGRVAMAQAVFRDPKSGEVLINGITSDADFNLLLKHVSEAGANKIGNGYSIQTIKEEIQTLQWGYDRILGRPMDNQQGNVAQALRMFRSTQIHKLANVGFSQVAESASILGQLGLRASLPHLKDAAKTMWRGKLDGRQVKNVVQEFEGIGIGVENAHGMNWNHGIDLQDARAIGENVKMKAVEQSFDAINRGVLKASFMPQLTDSMQKWAAAAMSQKLFNAGKKGFQSNNDMKRFAQLGLDRPMINRIYGQIEQHATTQPGLFSDKIGTLNFHSWVDREASAAFQDALFRASRKLVQTGDVGMSNMLLSHPVAQVITQFKTFSIQALANHTLYNLNMRDAQSLMTAVWGTMLGGSMYSLQTVLTAQGRGDKEKYLEDRLSNAKIAAASFQRNPLTSILPMIYDTAVPHMTGTKPMFDTRSSGNASNIWLGSPIAGSIDAFTSGLGGAFADRDMTQNEVRQLFGLVPFSQHFIMQNALSAMIADKPTRAPKPVDMF